jgi:enoyl-CoA hydratase
MDRPGGAKMPDAVSVEVNGGIAVITINHPEGRNAVNEAVARDIAVAIARPVFSSADAKEGAAAFAAKRPPVWRGE